VPVPAEDVASLAGSFFVPFAYANPAVMPIEDTAATPTTATVARRTLRRSAVPEGAGPPTTMTTAVLSLLESRSPSSERRVVIAALPGRLSTVCLWSGCALRGAPVHGDRQSRGLAPLVDLIETTVAVTGDRYQFRTSDEIADRASRVAWRSTKLHAQR
jgi:hypothetical protein